MELTVRTDLLAVWRCLAAILAYPGTIVLGASAVVLLISSCCVLLDCWSWEGALSNMFLGLLAAAGVSGFWISTLCPHGAITRTRRRFVLVTTGLLTGLIVNTLILKAKLEGDFNPVLSVDLFQAWLYLGPLLAGCVNLALLIDAQSRLSEQRALAPAPVSGVPRPHFRNEPNLTPVILRPYRPPVSLRADLREYRLP